MAEEEGGFWKSISNFFNSIFSNDDDEPAVEWIGQLETWEKVVVKKDDRSTIWKLWDWFTSWVKDIVWGLRNNIVADPLSEWMPWGDIDKVQDILWDDALYNWQKLSDNQQNIYMQTLAQSETLKAKQNKTLDEMIQYNQLQNELNKYTFSNKEEKDDKQKLISLLDDWNIKRKFLWIDTLHEGEWEVKIDGKTYRQMDYEAFKKEQQSAKAQNIIYEKMKTVAKQMADNWYHANDNPQNSWRKSTVDECLKDLQAAMQQQAVATSLSSYQDMMHLWGDDVKNIKAEYQRLAEGLIDMQSFILQDTSGKSTKELYEEYTSKYYNPLVFNVDKFRKEHTLTERENAILNFSSNNSVNDLIMKDWEDREEAYYLANNIKNVYDLQSDLNAKKDWSFFKNIAANIGIGWDVLKIAWSTIYSNIVDLSGNIWAAVDVLADKFYYKTWRWYTEKDMVNYMVGITNSSLFLTKSNVQNWLGDIDGNNVMRTIYRYMGNTDDLLNAYLISKVDFKVKPATINNIRKILVKGTEGALKLEKTLSKTEKLVSAGDDIAKLWKGTEKLKSLATNVKNWVINTLKRYGELLPGVQKTLTTGEHLRYMSVNMARWLGEEIITNAMFAGMTTQEYTNADFFMDAWWAIMSGWTRANSYLNSLWLFKKMSNNQIWTTFWLRDVAKLSDKDVEKVLRHLPENEIDEVGQSIKETLKVVGKQDSVWTSAKVEHAASNLTNDARQGIEKIVNNMVKRSEQLFMSEIINHSNKSFRSLVKVGKGWVYEWNKPNNEKALQSFYKRVENARKEIQEFKDNKSFKDKINYVRANVEKYFWYYVAHSKYKDLIKKVNGEYKFWKYVDGKFVEKPLSRSEYNKVFNYIFRQQLTANKLDRSASLEKAKNQRAIFGLIGVQDETKQTFLPFMQSIRILVNTLIIRNQFSKEKVLESLFNKWAIYYEGFKWFVKQYYWKDVDDITTKETYNLLKEYGTRLDEEIFWHFLEEWYMPEWLKVADGAISKKTFAEAVKTNKELLALWVKWYLGMIKLDAPTYLKEAAVRWYKSTEWYYSGHLIWVNTKWLDWSKPKIAFNNLAEFLAVFWESWTLYVKLEDTFDKTKPMDRTQEWVEKISYSIEQSGDSWKINLTKTWLQVGVMELVDIDWKWIWVQINNVLNNKNIFKENGTYWIDIDKVKDIDFPLDQEKSFANIDIKTEVTKTQDETTILKQWNDLTTFISSEETDYNKFAKIVPGYTNKVPKYFFDKIIKIPDTMVSKYDKTEILISMMLNKSIKLNDLSIKFNMKDKKHFRVAWKERITDSDFLRISLPEVWRVILSNTNGKKETFIYRKEWRDLVLYEDITGLDKDSLSNYKTRRKWKMNFWENRLNGYFNMNWKNYLVNDEAEFILTKDDEIAKYIKNKKIKEDNAFKPEDKTKVTDQTKSEGSANPEDSNEQITSISFDWVEHEIKNPEDLWLPAYYPQSIMYLEQSSIWVPSNKWLEKFEGNKTMSKDEAYQMLLKRWETQDDALLDLVFNAWYRLEDFTQKEIDEFTHSTSVSKPIKITDWLYWVHTVYWEDGIDKISSDVNDVFSKKFANQEVIIKYHATWAKVEVTGWDMLTSISSVDGKVEESRPLVQVYKIKFWTKEGKNKKVSWTWWIEEFWIYKIWPNWEYIKPDKIKTMDANWLKREHFFDKLADYLVPEKYEPTKEEEAWKVDTSDIDDDAIVSEEEMAVSMKLENIDEKTRTAIEESNKYLEKNFFKVDPASWMAIPLNKKDIVYTKDWFMFNTDAYGVVMDFQELTEHMKKWKWDTFYMNWSKYSFEPKVTYNSIEWKFEFYLEFKPDKITDENYLKIKEELWNNLLEQKKLEKQKTGLSEEEIATIEEQLSNLRDEEKNIRSKFEEISKNIQTDPNFSGTANYIVRLKTLKQWPYNKNLWMNYDTIKFVSNQLNRKIKTFDWQQLPEYFYDLLRDAIWDKVFERFEKITPSESWKSPETFVKINHDLKWFTDEELELVKSLWNIFDWIPSTNKAVKFKDKIQEWINKLWDMWGKELYNKIFKSTPLYWKNKDRDLIIKEKIVKDLYENIDNRALWGDVIDELFRWIDVYEILKWDRKIDEDIAKRFWELYEIKNLFDRIKKNRYTTNILEKLKKEWIDFSDSELQQAVWMTIEMGWKEFNFDQYEVYNKLFGKEWLPWEWDKVITMGVWQKQVANWEWKFDIPFVWDEKALQRRDKILKALWLDEFADVLSVDEKWFILANWWKINRIQSMSYEDLLNDITNNAQDYRSLFTILKKVINKFEDKTALDNLIKDYDSFKLKIEELSQKIPEDKAYKSTKDTYEIRKKRHDMQVRYYKEIWKYVYKRIEQIKKELQKIDIDLWIMWKDPSKLSKSSLEEYNKLMDLKVQFDKEYDALNTTYKDCVDIVRELEDYFEWTKKWNSKIFEEDWDAIISEKLTGFNAFHNVSEWTLEAQREFFDKIKDKFPEKRYIVIDDDWKILEHWFNDDDIEKYQDTVQNIIDSKNFTGRWMFEEWSKLMIFKWWNSLNELTTFWHEWFHASLNMFFNEREKERNIKTFDKVYDKYKNLIEENARRLWYDKMFWNIDEVSLRRAITEEWLAERFWEYVVNRMADEFKFDNDIIWLFKELWKRIRLIFCDDDALELFDEIYTRMEPNKLIDSDSLQRLDNVKHWPLNGELNKRLFSWLDYNDLSNLLEAREWFNFLIDQKLRSWQITYEEADSLLHWLSITWLSSSYAYVDSHTSLDRIIQNGWKLPLTPSQEYPEWSIRYIVANMINEVSTSDIDSGSNLYKAYIDSLLEAYKNITVEYNNVSTIFDILYTYNVLKTWISFGDIFNGPLTQKFNIDFKKAITEYVKSNELEIINTIINNEWIRNEMDNNFYLKNYIFDWDKVILGFSEYWSNIFKEWEVWPDRLLSMVYYFESWNVMDQIPADKVQYWPMKFNRALKDLYDWTLLEKWKQILYDSKYFIGDWAEIAPNTWLQSPSTISKEDLYLSSRFKWYSELDRLYDLQCKKQRDSVITVEGNVPSWNGSTMDFIDEMMADYRKQQKTMENRSPEEKFEYEKYSDATLEELMEDPNCPEEIYNMIQGILERRIQNELKREEQKLASERNTTVAEPYILRQIRKLQEQEGRLGMVGNNKVNADYKHKQEIEFLRKKEQLIQTIWDAYWLADQHQAYDKYIELHSRSVSDEYYQKRWWSKTKTKFDRENKDKVEELKEYWKKQNEAHAAEVKDAEEQNVEKQNAKVKDTEVQKTEEQNTEVKDTEVQKTEEPQVEETVETPTEEAEVPTKETVTPTDVTETPTKEDKVSTEVTETPTEVIETSTNVNETPVEEANINKTDTWKKFQKETEMADNTIKIVNSVLKEWDSDLKRNWWDAYKTRIKWNVDIDNKIETLYLLESKDTGKKYNKICNRLSKNKKLSEEERKALMIEKDRMEKMYNCAEWRDDKKANAESVKKMEEEVKANLKGDNEWYGTITIKENANWVNITEWEDWKVVDASMPVMVWWEKLTYNVSFFKTYWFECLPWMEADKENNWLKHMFWIFCKEKDVEKTKEILKDKKCKYSDKEEYDFEPIEIDFDNLTKEWIEQIKNKYMEKTVLINWKAVYKTKKWILVNWEKVHPIFILKTETAKDNIISLEDIKNKDTAKYYKNGSEYPEAPSIKESVQKIVEENTKEVQEVQKDIYDIVAEENHEWFSWFDRCIEDLWNRDITEISDEELFRLKDSKEKYNELSRRKSSEYYTTTKRQKDIIEKEMDRMKKLYSEFNFDNNSIEFNYKYVYNNERTAEVNAAKQAEENGWTTAAKQQLRFEWTVTNNIIELMDRLWWSKKVESTRRDLANKLSNIRDLSEKIQKSADELEVFSDGEVSRFNRELDRLKTEYKSKKRINKKDIKESKKEWSSIVQRQKYKNQISETRDKMNNTEKEIWSRIDNIKEFEKNKLYAVANKISYMMQNDVEKIKWIFNSNTTNIWALLEKKYKEEKNNIMNTSLRPELSSTKKVYWNFKNTPNIKPETNPILKQILDQSKFEWVDVDIEEKNIVSKYWNFDAYMYTIDNLNEYGKTDFEKIGNYVICTENKHDMFKIEMEHLRRDPYHEVVYRRDWWNVLYFAKKWSVEVSEIKENEQIAQQIGASMIDLSNTCSTKWK